MMLLNDITPYLQQASLFELFRLYAAIGKELNDTQRNAAIRARLKIGDTITYFDTRGNRLVKAKVMAVHKTRVHVHDTEGGQGWNLPFYMINLDHIDTAIVSTMSQGLSPHTVQVGDSVGFHHQSSDRDLYGRVVQCHRQSVKVFVSQTGMTWRVPYALLFAVIEDETLRVKDSDPSQLPNTSHERP